jgi:hypothetical protein
MSPSMKETPAFVAHVSSFCGVEDVFLVLANQATITWHPKDYVNSCALTRDGVLKGCEHGREKNTP